ncbi:MAG: 2-oxoacid:acceptor oxidoreductase subunit alpha [Ignavibacteriales bacterium]|nr:2-oxoacid:acceptor oxidoreductase subunit alpha [Ignavibacteriales bacterium]
MAKDVEIQVLEDVTVRFAGDSGDGMQLTGTQFTNTTALAGNDLSTLPDYPAEIRAPAGTLYGVSGYQLHFSSLDISTPGDSPDVLIAMNPAALKVNIKDLKHGATIIANTSAFDAKNLRLAEYSVNPLEDGSLDGYNVIPVPLTDLTMRSLEELKLSNKEKERCKNFFALGLMYWMYSRNIDSSIDWIDKKFTKDVTLAEANKRALRAGYNYGDTTEVFTTRYHVEAAQLPPGTYRNINGNEAIALGMITASMRAGVPLFLGSYPITPATEILQELSKYKDYGVKTFQAEDEISAVCAAIGASYAGSLSLTTTSGPGLSLKTEAIGLAVITELPLVIVNVQRGGPSTGLPTKTEQADLLQSMYSRNGEAPVVILAASSPADAFWLAQKASEIAMKYMVPVILLSDGYIANGSEPLLLPDVDKLEPIKVNYRTDPEGFHPYLRDENLARPWAIPGTPGLEHRIGGLEKKHIYGGISYDPENHELMTKYRADKVAKVAQDIPELEVEGESEGELLVLGWGSTFGPIRETITKLRSRGIKVSHAQLRYLNPFPSNTEAVLKNFKKVLVPELNNGQLATLIRSRFLTDVISYGKMQGLPFKMSELETKIIETLGVQ